MTHSEIEQLESTLQEDGITACAVETPTPRSLRVKIPGQFDFGESWWVGAMVERALPSYALIGHSWGNDGLSFHFEEKRNGGDLGWIGMPEYA